MHSSPFPQFLSHSSTINKQCKSIGQFRGEKGQTLEGGVRAPAIFKGKGIKPGSVSQVFASQMDIFVTFLELAGIAIPSDRIIDGVSLTNALYKDSEKVDRECYFYYRDSQLHAARCGSYKVRYSFLFTRKETHIYTHRYTQISTNTLPINMSLKQQVPRITL